MPLRLAIDAGNFARDRRGMGRFARAVAHVALAEPSFEVTFLLERKNDLPGVRTAFDGAELNFAPAHAARRRGRFDAVWFPWNGMRYGAVAPTLVTLHDVFAFTEPARGFIARRREQQPIVQAARKAALIATDSAFSRDEIARVLRVNPELIRVIPLAPDPFFFPATEEPPSEVDGRRFVLFVGGPERRKNSGMLFEAAARVLPEMNAVLAIAGTLSQGDEARLRSRRLPHVRLQPDDVQLRRLYRTAAAVAVPSLAEGFGLVAVEALACAAPVIASNAGALPEATRGAAMLVDPRDVRAWDTALRDVLGDSALASSMSAQGAATFGFASRAKPLHATLQALREIAGDDAA